MNEVGNPTTFHDDLKLNEVYNKALEKGAMFDARAFNVPREEVTNFIYWRQLDATRNSIQMVGQANFSHKELQNKSCNMIQDMLFTQRGINWNDLPTHLKRGSCCIKNNTNIAYIIDVIANPLLFIVPPNKLFFLMFHFLLILHFLYLLLL